jgi:MYXO-CTERM domain-containing protein/uncharacterized repeat protein (TIGR01451 family)
VGLGVLAALLVTLLTVPAARGRVSSLAVLPPVIAKQFGAARIPLNGTTSLLFNISNSNTTTLTGVGFTDTLPAGLVVPPPNGVVGSCFGGPITTQTNSISMTGATIPGNSGCSVNVTMMGTSGGVQNNATSEVTSNEGGTGNSATASLTVVAPPTLSKQFDPATIPLNGTSQLVFSLANSNATTQLTGVSFTDTLPAGLVVAPPGLLFGNCDGGTIIATPGTNSVSLSPTTIPSGFTCVFAVNVAGTSSGLWTNTTSVINSNEGGGGTPATASITVQAPTRTPTTTLTPTCILGDINCDGIVDIQDYGIWRQNFGQTNCGNPADLDGNCIVDIRDYGIWRANFGHTAGAAARTATPTAAPRSFALPAGMVNTPPGDAALLQADGAAPAVPILPLVGGLLGLGGLAGWRRRRPPPLPRE